MPQSSANPASANMSSCASDPRKKLSSSVNIPHTAASSPSVTRNTQSNPKVVNSTRSDRVVDTASSPNARTGTMHRPHQPMSGRKVVQNNHHASSSSSPRNINSQRPSPKSAKANGNSPPREGISRSKPSNSSGPSRSASGNSVRTSAPNTPKHPSIKPSTTKSPGLKQGTKPTTGQTSSSKPAEGGLKANAAKSSSKSSSTKPGTTRPTNSRASRSSRPSNSTGHESTNRTKPAAKKPSSSKGGKPASKSRVPGKSPNKSASHRSQAPGKSRSTTARSVKSSRTAYINSSTSQSHPSTSKPRDQNNPISKPNSTASAGAAVPEFYLEMERFGSCSDEDSEEDGSETRSYSDSGHSSCSDSDNSYPDENASGDSLLSDLEENNSGDEEVQLVDGDSYQSGDDSSSDDAIRNEISETAVETGGLDVDDDDDDDGDDDDEEEEEEDDDNDDDDDDEGSPKLGFFGLPDASTIENVDVRIFSTEVFGLPASEAKNLRSTSQMMFDGAVVDGIMKKRTKIEVISGGPVLHGAIVPREGEMVYNDLTRSYEMPENVSETAEHKQENKQAQEAEAEKAEDDDDNDDDDDDGDDNEEDEEKKEEEHGDDESEEEINEEDEQVNEECKIQDNIPSTSGSDTLNESTIDNKILSDSHELDGDAAISSSPIQSHPLDKETPPLYSDVDTNPNWIQQAPHNRTVRKKTTLGMAKQAVSKTLAVFSELRRDYAYALEIKHTLERDMDMFTESSHKCKALLGSIGSIDLISRCQVHYIFTQESSAYADKPAGVIPAKVIFEIEKRAQEKLLKYCDIKLYESRPSSLVLDSSAGFNDSIDNAFGVIFGGSYADFCAVGDKAYNVFTRLEEETQTTRDVWVNTALDYAPSLETFTELKEKLCDLGENLSRISRAEFAELAEYLTLMKRIVHGFEGVDISEECSLDVFDKALYENEDPETRSNVIKLRKEIGGGRLQRFYEQLMMRDTSAIRSQ